MDSRNREKTGRFSRAFLHELASAEGSVNPRCLSRHSIFATLDKLAQAKVESPTRTKSAALDVLLSLGILVPIQLDKVARESDQRTQFFSAVTAEEIEPTVNPLELLQAYRDDAVICYYSAVSFHALTTQPPQHHHLGVAIVRQVSPVERREAAPRASDHDSPARNALGSFLWRYKGIDYFRSTREARFLRGVQTRYIGAGALIRITDVEQTLLDVLQRPLCCGGPAVAVEAWERSADRLDLDRLAEYLEAMKSAALTQRCGYMVDSLGISIPAALRRVLDARRAELRVEGNAAIRQLFPGFSYSDLKSDWLLLGP